MPDDSPAISPQKAAMIGLGMIIVPMILLGGFMALRESAKSEVSGEIQLEGATLAPDRCESGILDEDAPRTQAEFHGVDLFASSAPSLRVRVLEDEALGMRVFVRREGETPMEISRESCETFDPSLRQTGAMILDRWGLEGHLRLACPNIDANVTFASCYGGE